MYYLYIPVLYHCLLSVYPCPESLSIICLSLSCITVYYLSISVLYHCLLSVYPCPVSLCIICLSLSCITVYYLYIPVLYHCLLSVYLCPVSLSIICLTLSCINVYYLSIPVSGRPRINLQILLTSVFYRAVSAHRLNQGRILISFATLSIYLYHLFNHTYMYILPFHPLQSFLILILFPSLFYSF